MRLHSLLPTIAFVLISPALVFAQKMLESHEWCGHKHTLPDLPVLLLGDSRSDSIDILRTDINLNLLGVPQVKAIASLKIKAKVEGVTSIRLDLEGLTVDSVFDTSGESFPFVQSGNAFTIQFPQALPTDSETMLNIHYQGVPPTDASGWGGYYNTGGYTFNLGVGFAADPHSYGRAWFPCFDNFVERCAFGITLQTPSNKPGYANGALVSDLPILGGVARTWEIEEPIPSYLACFAAGPYTSFKRILPGEAAQIPVEIAAAAADTVKVRNTFKNLQEAVDAYEYWFGPYRWNKVGYSLVPFNSGAMEHATNIAIGRAYIDGSLNYETLWAHELTHMWWGDLATCSTAEDMWLNEGWASYGEHLFTEKVYGQTAFRNAVRANHLNVLQTAHVGEGGYRAVSGLPHNLTYGKHVYNKGASVAHNLRGYLGDTLFRKGCREALAATNFEDWSSAEFRDKLEAATGKDLHDFFNDWVFAGGYPDFTIDSIEAFFSPIDAPTVYRLFVKQKLRGAPHYHQNVPLEFTFRMVNGPTQYRTGIVSGEQTVLDFSFPAFGPQVRFIAINTNLKLLQARSDGETWIKSTGAYNFQEAKWNMTVNNVGAPDSVFFRVEHHFAAPDNAGANPHGYVLSNRYWTVTWGRNLPVNPIAFDAQATLTYDGRGQLDQLDTELFAATGNSEDSVLLLFRPGAGHPWQEYPWYTKVNLGGAADKWGQLRPTNIISGEYTIGKGVKNTATKTPETLGVIRISPNPTGGKILVRADENFESATLVAADGATEKTWHFNATQEQEIDLNSFPAGQYWLVLNGKKGSAVRPVQKR